MVCYVTAFLDAFFFIDPNIMFTGQSNMLLGPEVILLPFHPSGIGRRCMQTDKYHLNLPQIVLDIVGRGLIHLSQEQNAVK